jgi:hypothetical protein
MRKRSGCEDEHSWSDYLRNSLSLVSLSSSFSLPEGLQFLTNEKDEEKGERLDTAHATRVGVGLRTDA